MTTTFKAHFDGKTVIPDEPIKLPKGKKLRVSVEVDSPSKKKRKLTLFQGIKPVKLGIPDASENLDKYIYGMTE